MRSAIVVLTLAAGCGGSATTGRRAEPVADPEPVSVSGSDPLAASGSASVSDPVTGPVPRSDPGSDLAPDSAPTFAAAFLDAHNRARAAHCAPPLSWSAELADVAQRWADELRARGCAFEHSRTPFGENLAAGTRGALDAAAATEMWYREVEGFDFARPRFAMSTGHFTQLVWVATARLGCGHATCNGLDVWVCNYDPPGNVEGGYRANVRPSGCR